MDAVSEADPSFFDDRDTLQERIDDLGIRYARESGEGKLLEGIKDKFLAAAARTQSKDELRALATGICVSILGEASDDPDDNILNCIFFRRALAGAVRSASLIGKVMDQLGGDVEELRHLIATNDPAARDKIESCLKSLTSSEMDTIQATFEKDHEELWDTISSGEFPVPMPFATQLALLGRFTSLPQNNGVPSPDAIHEITDAFCEELIEEDYVVYAQMLDRWLKQCEKRYSRVAKAVEMMTGLCTIRSIDDLVPSLFFNGFRKQLFVAFDDEERRFIDAGAARYDHPEFLAEYGAWLTAKGYPGMATRLLAVWRGQASNAPPDLLPARKAGVG